VGVVSAPARELEPDAAHVFVQTDAPITVGSSGGPLVDVSGEVVGVNMAMVSRSGGTEGVGLALPSGVARAVYAELRAHGRVRRGDIGATAQTVTPLLAAGLGLARPAGVIVSDVEPGGPAERAGVRVGDRVLAVDGRPIAGARELAGALVPRAPGDTLRLAVERGGHHGREAVERLDARVLVAEHRAPADPRERLRSRAPDAVAELGVVAVELDDSTAALSGGRVQPGVLVTSAPPRGAPSEDGLTAGDVVVWANGARVRTPAELRQAVHAAAPGAAVAMQVLRRGALRFVAAERR
jgi:serine protease Do